MTALDIPCNEWPKARNPSGYGVRRHNGKTYLAHRFAWEQANGPIPPGMCVLHRCDNPPCTEIEHLFLGTRTDNMRDMLAKGRGGQLNGERSGKAKLTDAQVAEIRRRRARGQTTTRLGKEFGVSAHHISRIAQSLARATPTRSH